MQIALSNQQLVTTLVTVPDEVGAQLKALFADGYRVTGFMEKSCTGKACAPKADKTPADEPVNEPVNEPAGDPVTEEPDGDLDGLGNDLDGLDGLGDGLGDGLDVEAPTSITPNLDKLMADVLLWINKGAFKNVNVPSFVSKASENATRNIRELNEAQAERLNQGLVKKFGAAD